MIVGKNVSLYRYYQILLRCACFFGRMDFAWSTFFNIGVVCMRKRMKMGRGKSKRDFRSKTGVHPKNINRGMPMRGGIRL